MAFCGTSNGWEKDANEQGKRCCDVSINLIVRICTESVNVIGCLSVCDVLEFLYRRIKIK